MPALRPAGLLVACVLVLSGCASYKIQQRVQGLDTAVRGYEDFIRWGRIDSAMALIKPRDPSTPAVDPDTLRHIRVATSDSTVLQVSPDGRTAKVRLTFDYEPPGSNVVHTYTEIETWWYDESAHGWFIDGSLPRLK